MLWEETKIGDEKLNNLLKSAATEINLASLVEFSWETVESRCASADDVKVTVDYTNVVEFLRTYGNRKGDDIPFLSSLPDMGAIEALVYYVIECGVGSGYAGRDDFNVVKIEYAQSEELRELIHGLEPQEKQK